MPGGASQSAGAALLLLQAAACNSECLLESTAATASGSGASHSNCTTAKYSLMRHWWHGTPLGVPSLQRAQRTTGSYETLHTTGKCTKSFSEGLLVFPILSALISFTI